MGYLSPRRSMEAHTHWNASIGRECVMDDSVHRLLETMSLNLVKLSRPSSQGLGSWRAEWTN